MVEKLDDETIVGIELALFGSPYSHLRDIDLSRTYGRPHGLLQKVGI
jgi:hypothetical protein